MFDDHLADRQTESRALLEGVEFDEAFENLFRFVCGDSATGVRDPEIEFSAAHFVSEPDAARLRELRGVGQQVDDHLREPVAVGADGALFVFLLEEQFDALPDLHADDILLLPHQFVQVEVRVDEVERPRLDFREVEDVADELQQQGVVVFDDRDVFLLLLLLFGRGQNARKSDDGVERRAYLVAHVGQKRRFQAVRLFGAVAGREEFLLHAFAFGDDLRRSDERLGPSLRVERLHGGQRFDPFHVPVSAFVGDHAVLFADLVRTAGYQVVVGLPYAVAVLLVYLREIAFVAYRKRSFVLQDRLSGGGFDRFVDVAEDGAVVQVAFPRNDVGHVERQRELVVDRVQFLLRLVQRGAVQTEDVDVVGQVRAAQNHFEKDVQRFVVEGIGDGPVFRQDDVHEPQELGERIGEKFAPPFADDLIPGQERPFEVGVYVAEFRIGGIVFLVEYDPFLNVDDRHPVEQVRIFYLAFRFPSAGRFDLSHDADAPLLEEDEQQEETAA